MAGFLLPFTLSLLATLSLTFPVIAKPSTLKSVSLSSFKLGTEKLSHFQFYWHDIQGGTNPTSIAIINPPTVNSSTRARFGTVYMIDNAMTEKLEIGSKMLGQAQGFYGLTSKEEISMLMTMNFVFTTGRYNGSTLTVLGRNPVTQKMREMPVVGGSGLFRFARGYVQLSTYRFNPKTGDAIVRYNVYVLHY